MRVLHVIPAVAPRYGGPSAAIVGMCQALQRHGVQTQIVTTDADGPGHLSVTCGSPTVYQDVPTLFFPRQWSEAFKYSRPLADWLNHHVSDYDVVHIHAVFSHSCLAAAGASRRHHVPYVVRPLGTLDPWSLRQKSLRKRAMWQLGGRNMLARAAAVHYTTADEQRRAEATLGLSRGTVIPLGLDESQYVRPVATDALARRVPGLADARYVLVLSRLHPKKGIEVLIDSFLDVVRQDSSSDWRLVIAGDGDPLYVARLRDLTHASDRVVFTGWLGGEEKLAALQHASLMALPSRQENFGLALAESLICGVPVLVTADVGLAEDIVAAGAGWVSPLERDSLARALATALGDEHELGRRGSAGRRFVMDRFTWTAVASQLLQLYCAVAPGPIVA